MRRKTYNEALLEDLHGQITYWRGQAEILRKERDDERRRAERYKGTIRRLEEMSENDDKVIKGLSAEVLRLKQEKLKEAQP